MGNLFIDELNNIENNHQNETKLLKEKLKQELIYVAKLWAKEILAIIKENIRTRAISQDYKILNGKKVIEDFFTLRQDYKLYNDTKFLYKGYNNEKETKIKEILSKCKERKIYIDDLVSVHKEGEYLYFTPSIKWNSEVKKCFNKKQHVFGIITLGLGYLSLFLQEGETPRLCKGTVKFDFLTGKVLNLLVQQLKDESIDSLYFYIGGVEFKNQDFEKNIYIELFRDIDCPYIKINKGEELRESILLFYEVTFD